MPIRRFFVCFRYFRQGSEKKEKTFLNVISGLTAIAGVFRVRKKCLSYRGNFSRFGSGRLRTGFAGWSAAQPSTRRVLPYDCACVAGCVHACLYDGPCGGPGRWLAAGLAGGPGFSAPGLSVRFVAGCCADRFGMTFRALVRASWPCPCSSAFRPFRLDHQETAP